MQSHKAMELPSELLRNGRASNDFINCATVGTGENAKQPHKSIELLAGVQQLGPAPNAIAYSVAFSAGDNSNQRVVSPRRTRCHLWRCSSPAEPHGMASFCTEFETVLADYENCRRCYSMAGTSQSQLAAGPSGATAPEGGEPAGVTAASSSESACGSGSSSSIS